MTGSIMRATKYQMLDRMESHIEAVYCRLQLDVKSQISDDGLLDVAVCLKQSQKV